MRAGLFPAARFPALIQQMTEVAADSQFKSTEYKYRQSTQFSLVVKLQQLNSLKYNISYYYFKIMELITFKYYLQLLNYKTQKQQTLPFRPDREASVLAGMEKQSGFHRGTGKDAGGKTSARPLPESHIWPI
ncbi:MULTISPECIES: hypothetical protein [Rhizobium/Agrobacterium group]|uniref:hypothetical protein n=1 Tax=Rhizobium/Agrobacterium group TaxID=227290 RepID=UPI00107F1A78|nr:MULTISPECIES: hypothetical protein [Rhizobium/Agrobacterium group]MBB4401173.1 hypothetical protein [Agrobacterium radiobacter]MBB5588220.1 hypothetical protein [Agrobacterium radiobacter]